MNGIRVLIAGAALMSAGGCHAFEAESIFGTWKVSEVYCRSCASVSDSDAGAGIEIFQGRVDNALAGGACPGKTSFRILPSSSGARAAASEKLKPAWLKPASKLNFVSSTCDGIDFMLFVMIPDGSLVYVPEGEIVYRLSRAPDISK